MRKQHSSEATVQFIPSTSDIPVTAGAVQEARRATEAAPAVTAPHASTEVVPRPKRRFKSNAEKRRIVAEADACTLPGEVGLLMRREGIYSSLLATWRKQRSLAQRSALESQKRGPKANPLLAQKQGMAQLTRDNERLRRQLAQAHTIIDVQKKVSSLLGLLMDEKPQGSS